MYETSLETMAFGLLSFLFGIMETIINFCVVAGLVYGLFYVFCRYFVCQNNKDEWEWFLGDIRSGLKDLAKAFKEVAPGIHESAKCWASEKIENLKARK